MAIAQAHYVKPQNKTMPEEEGFGSKVRMSRGSSAEGYWGKDCIGGWRRWATCYVSGTLHKHGATAGGAKLMELIPEGSTAGINLAELTVGDLSVDKEGRKIFEVLDKCYPAPPDLNGLEQAPSGGDQLRVGLRC